MRSDLWRALAVGSLASIALASEAAAQISAAMDRPAAVRGGVIAIPLHQHPANESWPSSLGIAPVDGAPAFEGVVAWIGAKAPPMERSWTQSQEQLDIRPIADAPKDHDPEVSGSVVLLARTPRDVRGRLRVGDSTIEPTWLELAELEPDGAKLPLALGDPYALPDPESPSEWFRWWLLADQADRKPPPASGDEAQRLFALHRAQLWQAGIERIERQSPGVAAEIRERLTAVCTESGTDSAKTPTRKACWIANAEALSSLLASLITTDRTDEQSMQASLGLLRNISPVTLWPEADDGRAIHFAACNASPEEIVIQFAWVEAPSLPPLAMLLPPYGMGRLSIDRPAELMPDPLTGESSPIVGSLQLTGPGGMQRMSVAPAQCVIRPPGYSLGLFLPMLSLADAQTGKIQPVPAGWGTTASVRRKFGRWEIFAECLRREVRLEDELDLRIGDSGRPMGRVRVGEAGVRGVDAPGGAPEPEVRTDSFADRWRCVIEIPEEWLPADAKGRPFVIGISRSTSGAASRQSAIAATPPWHVGPPLIQLEASKWIDPPVQRVISAP
ncbi:MAG: hypothetical protein K8R92_05295 [Planctomycetes bacterium]|nr:hypothetical protein [Planctomycetota bacterium]